MPLKILGCALVVLSGFCAGCFYSLGLSKRKGFLEQTAVFLELLQTNIRFSSADIFSAVQASVPAKLQSVFILEKSADKSFEEIWKQAVDLIPKNSGINNSDRELLINIGSELGKTDVDGQLSHLELCSSLVAVQLSDARETLLKKTRLYRALGLFAGVSIAIIII